MSNLAFELVANFKDNISPAINQLQQNASNLSKQFDDSKGKLFQFEGASKKMGSAIQNLSGGMINGSEATKLLSSAFGGLTPQMMAALGVAGLAAAAMVKLAGAFNQAMGDVQKLGDEIDKGSQKIGFSSDAFQKWDYVLNLNGSSIEKLTPGINKLQKSALEAAQGSEKAASSFSALGVNVKDSSGNLKSSEVLFGEVVKSLGKMDNETHRTAIAMKLFGESGTDLAPMLNKGSDAIDRVSKEAERFAIMQERTVKASAALSDSQYKLGKAMDNIKSSIVTPMMERLNEVYEMIIDSGIIEFFVELGRGIGVVIDVALFPLTKMVEGVCVAFNGLELIVRGALIGVGKSFQSLLSIIPEKFIPAGWKSGVDEFVTKQMADFDDAVVRAEKNAAKLFSLKPKIEGSETGGGGELIPPIDKDADKKAQAAYEKRKAIIAKLMAETERIKIEIHNDGFDERKKLLEHEYKEKKSLLSKQFADEEKQLRDEAATVGANDKQILQLRGQRNQAIASLNEQLELRISQLTEDEAKRRQAIIEQIEKETQSVRLSAQKDGLEKTLQILEMERDNRISTLRKSLGDTVEFEKAKLEIQNQYAIKERAARDASFIEHLKTEDEKIEKELEKLEAFKRINDRINELEITSSWESLKWKNLFTNKGLRLLDERYRQEQEAYKDNKDALIALEQEYNLQREILRQEDITRTVEGFNSVFQSSVNAWGALERAHQNSLQQQISNLEKAKSNELKTLDKYGKTAAAKHMDLSKVRTDIETKYEKDIDKIKADAEKENRKRMQIYKGVAAAAAIMDSLVGAVSAFKAMAGIPYVGPALGAAASAAAIAMGIANAKQIKAQQFETGGFPKGTNALIRVNERGQEAVLNARAVQYVGKETINALNAGLKLGNEQSITINAPITFNANTIDQTALPSFEQALEEHQVVIARLIEDAYSKNMIDRSRI